MFDVIKLVQTESFKSWIIGLRDRTAAQRIEVRLLRLQRADPGDVTPVGESIWEMRIDYGPGYRVYYGRSGPLIIVLLGGGDKSSRAADIRRAELLARDWKE
jgi:putative addiction module killer protein